MTTIIVDRVGNTNVFNIIKNNSVSNPVLVADESLYSRTDDDLIAEYLEELQSIAGNMYSVAEMHSDFNETPFSGLSFPHSARLRQAGYSFYRQFFPESIQSYIRETTDSSVLFHIAPPLSVIPYELLHDGSNFLLEKFSVGKIIKGQMARDSAILVPTRLNVLIIADPAEDLEWARREGETLFEYLNEEATTNQINVELIGGKSATKLALLNALPGKDIIHYAGHFHFSGTPGENGWVLYADKILHAREIHNSGSTPLLYFTNSCSSAVTTTSAAGQWHTRFAAAFIHSGSTSYIGTNWDIPDSRETLEFTMDIYRNILKGMSIGSALQKTRLNRYAKHNTNDLLWASYMLLGSPDNKLVEKNSVPDLNSSILDTEMVLSRYPYPIARSYANLTSLPAQDSAEYFRDKTIALFHLFSSILAYLGALILANYRFMKFPRNLLFDRRDTFSLLENTFSALASIRALKAFPLAPNLAEVLYRHKDNLYRMYEFEKKYTEDQLQNTDHESLIISLEFFLESILIDLDFLKHYGFYFITEPGHRQLSLSGTEVFHTIIEILLPTQMQSDTIHELLDKTQPLVGHCVFYNPVKKIFLDVSPFLDLQITQDESGKNNYRLVFRDIPVPV